jgi:hypothetical protein
VKKEPRYNAPPSRTEIPIFISHPKASFYLMVEGKMAKSLNEWGWIVIFFYFVSPLTRQLEAAISSQLEVNLTLEQDGMVGVDESEWVRINSSTPHFFSSFFIIFSPFFNRIINEPFQQLDGLRGSTGNKKGKKNNWMASLLLLRLSAS